MDENTTSDDGNPVYNEEKVTPPEPSREDAIQIWTALMNVVQAVDRSQANGNIIEASEDMATIAGMAFDVLHGKQLRDHLGDAITRFAQANNDICFDENGTPREVAYSPQASAAPEPAEIEFPEGCSVPTPYTDGREAAKAEGPDGERAPNPHEEGTWAHSAYEFGRVGAIAFERGRRIRREGGDLQDSLEDSHMELHSIEDAGKILGYETACVDMAKEAIARGEDPFVNSAPA